jgi:ferric-dicitrate binding protein FerR (iron transport regulator)
MRCPNPETLAAFAEDRLARSERERLLDHAADCDECRLALLSLPPARARARVRPPVRSWIPWGVAAALFIAIVGLLALRRGPEPKPEAPVAEVPERPEAPPPPELPKPEPAPRPEFPKPQPPPETPKPVPRPEEPVPPEEKPPVPTPEPGKPAPEKPPATPAPVRPPTLTVVAVLDRAEGEVLVLGAGGRIAVKAGQSLRPDDGLECRGLARIVFPDQTKVEASGETLIREISDAKGKRLRVEKGTVTAEVAKQPEGMPLVFSTPHGEAKVVGTTLRIHVDPDPKKGTRLEVGEGKVELRNAAGRSVLVEAGRQAVAATGLALAARLAPREEVVYALDFEDGKLPPGDFTGTVQRGPQNRLCLAGSDSGGTCKVFIGPPAGILHFEGDEVLSFDYWVDGSAEQVNLNLWNRTAKLTHDAVVPKHVLSKWARATFRLADMGAAGARLKEGDLVANLYVQGTGGPPTRRFYIDNIQFTRPWSVALKK